MSDSEAKTKPASSRKLGKQREEGNLAGAQDLTGLIAAACGLAVLAATAGLVWEKLKLNIIATTTIIHLPFDDALRLGLEYCGRILLWTVVPIAAATIATAIVVLIMYNGGIVFALKPVLPQLNRVSMTAGFKRIFGKRGWIELAFLLVRLFVWFAVASAALIAFVPRLLRSTECGGLCQFNQVEPMIWLLIIGAIVVMVAAAGVDMILQRRLYLDEQKMTESEVKRENKQNTGSPEVRRERNRINQENAVDAPVKPGIANATIVVFDGADRAIAINYSPPENTLPRIVAKSRSAEATHRLRQSASQLGVPQVYHRDVTRGGLSVGIGSVLEESAFNDFARVLQQAFPAGS